MDFQLFSGHPVHGSYKEGSVNILIYCIAIKLNQIQTI